MQKQRTLVETSFNLNLIILKLDIQIIKFTFRKRLNIFVDLSGFHLFTT